MPKFIIFGVLILTFACKMNKKVPFPALAIPANNLILYEQVHAYPADRSDNFRFYLDNKGHFYHTRNKEEDFREDDYFNVPFSVPVRVLSISQLSDFEVAMAAFSQVNIRDMISPDWKNEQSHPHLCRWTFFMKDKSTYKTLIFSNGNEPKELKNLRQVLDSLIIKADFFKE